MAARIEDQLMTAEFDGRVVVTARYSADSAVASRGGRMVSGLPRRAFTRHQAITAMVLAERLAASAFPAHIRNGGPTAAGIEADD